MFFGGMGTAFFVVVNGVVAGFWPADRLFFHTLYAPFINAIRPSLFPAARIFLLKVYFLEKGLAKIPAPLAKSFHEPLAIMRFKKPGSTASAVIFNASCGIL